MSRFPQELSGRDVIIAGAGCAGLSLAGELQRQGFPGRVLIVERDAAAVRDRNWAFWVGPESGFREAAVHEWEKLEFVDEVGATVSGVGKKRYVLLNSSTYLDGLRAELERDPRFHFVSGQVDGFAEGEGNGRVRIDGHWHQAAYVFDATGRLPAPGHPGERTLLQHFAGWWVRTAGPVFQPERATLMDFRVAQAGQARFFYLLPVSKDRALVEFTIFSRETVDVEVYEAELRRYMTRLPRAGDYVIEGKESGVIPMSNRPVAFVPGQRVIPIGTAGGAVKPTTGYAFLRIQTQVKRIAMALVAGRAPDPRLVVRRRFRFYDRLLLDILEREDGAAREIFGELFHGNRFEDILRFLDEESRLAEDLRLLATLPLRPFLLALWRTIRAEGRTLFSNPRS